MKTSTVDLDKLSPEQRRALLKQMMTQRANSKPLPDAPLSLAQQRLWFLARLDPDGPAYNLLTAYRLTGSLDMTALERSLSWLVARHESLRVVCRSKDGKPVQEVLPTPEQALEIIEAGE